MGNCFSCALPEVEDVEDLPPRLGALERLLRPRHQSASEYSTFHFPADLNTAIQAEVEGSQRPITAVESHLITLLQETQDQKPRLLLMGEKRSGKSSISSVVFHRVAPSDTLFIESTRHINVRSFMDFQMWDCPANLILDSPTSPSARIFENLGSMIYVIDAQDNYREVLGKVVDIILFLQQNFPHINLEVFVHKMDGVSEDFSDDYYQDIKQRIMDDLADVGYENAPVTFYKTSIYDMSVYDALSKIIQKLIPRLWALERLLDDLVRTSRIEKAYLVEIASKVYIASDTSPSDIQSYETCTDFLDMVVDLCGIFSWRDAPRSGGGDGELGQGEPEPAPETEAEVTMATSHGKYMVLYEVTKDVALVAIMMDTDPEDNREAINYNIRVFAQGVRGVLELKVPQDGENEEGQDPQMW